MRGRLVGVACAPTATASFAVTEAEAHSRDDLFAKHIEPEPAPEDPMEWAMAEASDDEDNAPMPDAPPEPEITDMRQVPASGPPSLAQAPECVEKNLFLVREGRWLQMVSTQGDFCAVR